MSITHERFRSTEEFCPAKSVPMTAEKRKARRAATSAELGGSETDPGDAALATSKSVPADSRPGEEPALAVSESK